MEKLVLLRHLRSCADAMSAFCNRKAAQVAEAAAQDITAMRATLSAKQNALTGQPGQVVGFGADGKPEAQDPLGFIKETMAKASLMHALTFGLPITYYVTKSGNWGDTPYPPKASILKEGTVTAAVSGSGTAAFFTLNTGSGFSMVNGAQYLYLCPPLGLASPWIMGASSRTARGWKDPNGPGNREQRFFIVTHILPMSGAAMKT